MEKEQKTFREIADGMDRMIKELELSLVINIVIAVLITLIMIAMFYEKNYALFVIDLICGINIVRLLPKQIDLLKELYGSRAVCEYLGEKVGWDR